MGKKVAIIGAGAAGCFCAANLSRLAPDMEITLLEAGPKPLAKVAITGGGRCNLTNSFENIKSLGKAYPRGEQLMKRALKAFSNNDIQTWFETEGVPMCLQDDGCVFPESQDAMDIVGALVRAMRRGGVQIICRARVNAIVHEGPAYRISFCPDKSGFLREDFMADYVVVTTGGSPTQAGLSFMKGLGMDMIAPVPSLFSFNIPDKGLKALMGTVVENASVSLCGSRLSGEGPLLVTHWGISGPATLKLSSYAARILAERNYKAEISINWLPEYNNQECRGMLEDLFYNSPHKMLAGVHPDGIPSRLWVYLLERSGLSASSRCAEVGKKGLNHLVETLGNCIFNIDGKSRFKEEFVTCGGVALTNINIGTLEAKAHSGLFLAGEVLDVDAITGGFNLQAAWSMGMICAREIASR